MADKGIPLGPGEEAHNGFKIFGLSVNQFAATVAGFDVLSQAIDKKLNKASKDSAKQTKQQADIARQQQEAAQTQQEAADTNNDIADEARRQARQNKVNLTRWQKITSTFKLASDKMAENAKKGFTEFIGNFGGVIKNLGGIIKDFAARFVVVFTLVNILTRILERLISVSDFSNQSRRLFGNQFTGRAANLVKSARQNSGGLALTADQVKEIAVSLNSELKDSSRISGELVGTIAKVAHGLNIDATQAAQFFGRTLRTSDASVSDIQATFADTAEIAAQVGLTVDELGKELANNVDLAQQFFLTNKQGRLELARGAAEARLLGTSLQSVRSFGDQFFDIKQAIETSARARALGLSGVGARGLVTGAIENPSELAKKFLVGIEKKYGALKAVGQDRVTLELIRKQLPTLGALFSTTEELSNALQVIHSGDLDKVGKTIQKAQQRAEEAKNFESYALKDLHKLVTNGDSLEQTMNKLADNIAFSIADSLQPLFNKMINAIRDLVNALNSSPFFNRGKTTEQMNQESAVTGIETYLKGRITSNIGTLDTNNDRVISPEEISTAVAAQIAVEEKAQGGKKISSDQQQKILDELMNFISIQKSLLENGQSIKIKGTNNRELMNGILQFRE